MEAPAHAVLDELAPEVRHVVDFTGLLELGAKAKATVGNTIALAQAVRSASCMTTYRRVAQGAEVVDKGLAGRRLTSVSRAARGSSGETNCWRWR